MTFRITCLNNDTVRMDKGMWGEHGVSYLIEKDNDRILFDTGTSWEIVKHNLKEMGIQLNDVTQIVLSHGHYDHTGGLMGALEQIQQPRLVADPLIFNKKFSRNLDTGELHEIGMPYACELVQDKASLLLTREPVALRPGMTVTGRVTCQTGFEQTPQNMLVEVDGALEQDTLPDDRSMILATDKGLVLLTGCCHAGPHQHPGLCALTIHRAAVCCHWRHSPGWRQPRAD